MKKQPKYTVEQHHSPTFDKPTWLIWINDNDIIFWDERTANQVCEALNMADELKKNNRKIRELYSSLSRFVDED